MKSKKEQFISPKILLPHIDLASLPLLSLQFMLEIPAVFTITYTDTNHSLKPCYLCGLFSVCLRYPPCGALHRVWAESPPASSALTDEKHPRKS